MIEKNLKDNMKKQELLIFWKKIWLQNSIVEQILMKKTGLNKSQFFLIEELNISENDLEELWKIFKKTAFWYPIEYILEKAEFYGLDFYVDKRCLIPRNDTEIMVDETIKEISNSPDKGLGFFYIDVWTGSWAIPISVYKNSWENIKKAFAVDISIGALEVAKKNIKNHNLENKIELLKSDLLENINLSTEGFSPLYVITANLPYIKDEDYWNMDKEVILYEPSIALYWWKKTGFELYEKLIEQILKYKIKAILFIEIWFDQKKIATNYLNNKKLNFKIFKDNWAVERCIKIKF